VSYALRLAAEARRGLAQLPSAIQEQALDVIDALAVDPPKGSRGGSVLLPEEVYDIVRTWENKRYYVFIVVRCDHRMKTVRVDSVGHFIRPERSAH
jgi:hypothetical protein